jgi:hypothetical protein
MIYAYLDLNVFDRLQKKDNLDKETYELYSKIEELITTQKIVCPYSNAHINDLLRGHLKNPEFIPKHLENIRKLTNNLCIVQYWGNPQITWHYREIEEFFQSALDDKEATTKPFTALLSWDESGLAKNFFELLRLAPVPSNLINIFDLNPIFYRLFPKTKTDKNLLALCEDLYEFSNNTKKDYSLYKSLRTYANQSIAKAKIEKKLVRQLTDMSTSPTYLNIDEIWEQYSPKTKTSENPVYQKIIDTYFKIDLKGYKSDDKFSNLFDDSLHVFYGAHCDYFITNDDNCHYKAAETYHKLGINTRAIKPKDLIYFIDSKNLT